MFEQLILPFLVSTYSVGTMTYHLVDEKRKETHVMQQETSEESTTGQSTTSEDKPAPRRELMLRIWYPADVDATPRVAYDENLRAFWKKQAYWTPLQREQLGQLDTIMCHAQKDVPVTTLNNAFPIVLLSHGFTSMPIMHTIQAQELASHGYIVVGINHTHASTVSFFPDAREVACSMTHLDLFSSPNAEKETEIWLDDIKAVLDLMPKLNADPSCRLYGWCDTSKIGVMGHSFGGSTAVQAARVDKRIKAGINLDGALFGKNQTQAFDKPFLFLLGDQSLSYVKDTPEEQQRQRLDDISSEQFAQFKQAYIEHIPLLYSNLTSNAYKVTIKGLDHLGFNDCLSLQELPLFSHFNVGKEIDNKRMITVLNDMIISFFNRHLKGKGKLKWDEVLAANADVLTVESK